MRIRQRRWWILGVLCLLLCVGFVLIAYRFHWSGTGFLNKTLWDWLQLLIIPVVLALAALLFNLATTWREQKIAAQRYNQDQYIALEKQREDLLQTYLDRMSELLLDKQLGTSKLNTVVRNVARVRTITILFQLDAKRIGYVFAFLREAGLMSAKSNDNVVSLQQADLSKINFSQGDLAVANLSGAKLDEADFSQALLFGINLSRASLNGANFHKAFLYKANLAGADLTGADLTGGVLTEANLTEALLADANLSGACLDKAILFKTNFILANLSGADLSGADLSDVNLSQADLTGTNLTGVKLENAVLTEEQIKQAKPALISKGRKRRLLYTYSHHYDG